MHDPDVRPALLPAHAQPLLAVAAGAALVGMAAWFLVGGGLHGGLVHHDAAPAASVFFTVDVNAAPVEELVQLPGLGPATARRIVDHRAERGRFTSIEGLLDVPGIGPATLDGIRPHLRPIPPPETRP